MSLQNHEVWANGTTPLFLQNPTTSITLAGTPPLVLSNDNGTLTENGQPSPPTPQWSLFPALNNKIFMDASNVITNIGEFLYFDNNLLAYAQDIPNIGNWSFYPQNYNVNGANHTIYSNAGLDSTGVIATTGYVSTPAISTTGTLVTTANRFSNAGVTGSDTLIDRGLDVFGDASYSVTAQNGRRGALSFTANGGNNNGSNGQVDITANGSTIGSFATGGLINIVANTPVSSNYTFTSAIKMTASSMLSYAGSFSPLLSLAGYNYIWGQGGVNITSTPTPPSIAVPNTAGSVFISGFAGTKISNGLYVDTITNYAGQDLTIASPVFSGSNANISVVSGKELNLTALTGTAGAVVINGNTTNVTGHAGHLNLTAVDGGNIYLYGNTIMNGPSSNFFSFASKTIYGLANMYGDTNIHIVPGASYVTYLDGLVNIGSGGGALVVSGNLDMVNNNIINVNTETFRYGGSITTGLNTGTSQGFLTINYPSAGTGHSNDGALFLKGGTAGGTSGERYIGIDSTNIDIYIPTGSGNLYLSANTIMNGGFLSASNIINAQTISSPALSNLTIQANSSSLILKAPGNSIIAESDVRLNGGNLFLNNNRIYDVTSIYASTSTGSNFDLGGGGAGHYFTLYNGSAYLQFSSSLDAYMGASNINLTPSAGCSLYIRGPTSFEGNSITQVNTITAQKLIGTYGNTPIASVSALALVNGDPNSVTGRSQIEFQYNGGGFNHYIASRHNASFIGNNSNAIDFWLYSTTGGQTSSPAPNNGNVNAMSVTARGVGIFNATPTSALDVNGDIQLNSHNLVNVSNISASSNMSVTATSNLTLTGTGMYINGGAGNINISAPATGINGGPLYMNNNDLNDIKNLTRKLGSTSVNQPVIQYGTFTGTGASGSQVVNLPTAYTSSTSYIAQASMMDVDPARVSINRNSASQITIYWAQAGGGAQILSWSTMGT